MICHDQPALQRFDGRTLQWQRLKTQADPTCLICHSSASSSFSLALDLRQHAAKHGETIAELFHHAGLENYLELNEHDKQTVFVRELKSPRPLYDRFAVYNETAQYELAIFQAARYVKDTFGENAINQSIISNCEQPSDI